MLLGVLELTKKCNPRCCAVCMRVLDGAPQAQLHWHEMHASWHKVVVSEVTEKVQYLKRVKKKIFIQTRLGTRSPTDGDIKNFLYVSKSDRVIFLGVNAHSELIPRFFLKCFKFLIYSQKVTMFASSCVEARDCSCVRATCELWPSVASV